MTKPLQEQKARHPAKRLTRRDVIKLTVAASVLAGCRALEKEITPTQAPTAGATATSKVTATPTIKPTEFPSATPTMIVTKAPTEVPTSTPTSPPMVTSTSAPTASPTAAPTASPTVAPTNTADPALSTVVRARHVGVWEGGALVPAAIRQMLDASIATLTGSNSADTAWATLFSPEERIAIKVNTIRGSDFWTHVPLVMAVTERLQQLGIPPEQIVIFDRLTTELQSDGYPVNQDGPGVRCFGTDSNYVAGWEIMDTAVKLSSIVLDCDALINMPIMKQHGMAGISFAMKNHYGTFDKPGSLHGGRMARGMAELNALPAIKDRTRLVIGDMLRVSTRSWSTGVMGDSILVSFDPVAHDTVGLKLYSDVMTSEGLSPESAIHLTSGWLANGAELGLGTNNLDDIELKEVNLG